jgi:hypothetical protein
VRPFFQALQAAGPHTVRYRKKLLTSKLFLFPLITKAGAAPDDPEQHLPGGFSAVSRPFFSPRRRRVTYESS